MTAFLLLRSGRRQRCPHSPLLFNIVLKGFILLVLFLDTISDTYNLKEERFNWLTLLVCSRLAARQKHYGGKMWRSKAAQFMVAEKESTEQCQGEVKNNMQYPQSRIHDKPRHIQEDALVIQQMFLNPMKLTC